MAQQYYFDTNGTKDGPLDLLTVMRRIRAKKIGPDTPIYVDDAERTVPASTIHDIALFFSQNTKDDAKRPDVPAVAFTRILRDSFHFTFEHNIITVYAGGTMLLALLLAMTSINAMGSVAGGMLSWVTLVILHYIFFVCTLRIYRMQPFSADFINNQLAPVLPTLFIAGIILALMMVGGFSLLVIPGVVVAIYYIFVPFFIYDRRMSLIEAMVASRLLVRRYNQSYQHIFGMLIMMHVGCLILIFPIPLTLPIFAVSIARIYEDLSIS